MTHFDRLWLRQTGGLLLDSAPDVDRTVLLWAHAHKYIVLPKAPSGAFAYTQEQLITAKMWKEKMGE